VKAVFWAYGLPALLVVSVIESMLLVGGYFPGGTVIFIDVVLAEIILETAVAIGVVVSGRVCLCASQCFGNWPSDCCRAVFNFGLVHESRFLPGCA